MKKISLVLLLLIFLNGCGHSSGDDESTKSEETTTTVTLPDHLQGVQNLNAFPADTEPTHEIVLTGGEVADPIYPNNRPPVIGSLVAVDDRGYIFHGNRSQNSIDVYNPDGEQVASLGRSGRGPGEFTDISWVASGEGIVSGLNLQQYRAHLYSTGSYSLQHTIELDPAKWQSFEEIRSGVAPAVVHVVNDTTFIGRFSLATVSGGGHGFYTMNDNGDIISDQLIQMPASELTQFDLSGWPYEIPPPSEYTLKFNRKSLYDFSTAGRIVSAWTEDFVINVFDFSGNEIYTIFYPFEKRELTIDDEGLLHDDLSELFIDYIPEDSLPDTWPALQDLLIDDQNRLWVSTITSKDDSYQWWLLNPEGGLISRFDWPRTHQFIDVKDQNLYTLATDPESGIQHVMKYQIELTERESVNN